MELDLDVVSYTEAAAEHDRAAERHDKAAGYWARRGDPEWADLEQQTARIEREAAQVDRLRARVARRRQVQAPEGAGLRVSGARGPMRRGEPNRCAVDRGGASIR